MNLKTPVRLVIFCLFILSAINVYPQQGSSLTYYVSTTGKSGNPGTLNQPFSRPEEAYDAICKVDGPVNATIYIREGNYPFSKTLSLFPSSADTTRHIHFAAYQNEKVTFTGGQTLDPAKFTLVTDPAILNKLPASARNKVYQFNLKDARITDYGKRVVHGYKTVRVTPLELFYNKTPMIVARYPNTGYLPIGTVADRGGNSRDGGHDSKDGVTFSINDDRINNWKTAQNAWIEGFFSYGYSDENLSVDAFDIPAKSIHTRTPAVYGVYSSDNASTGPLKNAQKIRGFYVYNLLEELDTAGEYYLDESSGILYCWPPDNAIAKANIEVSMLEDPILLLSRTWNMSFTGLTFENSRGMAILLDGTRNTSIENCTFNDLGTVAISCGSQLNEKRVVFSAREGQPTVNKQTGFPYNTNLTIQSCRIYNTGAGGIYLDGGDRKTLTPANNVVDNCEIYNYERINKTFTPAVSLGGVGNSVTHCDIHGAPGMAIIFYGNDLVIANNRIHDVATYMTDAGAVCTGRDLATTGDTIRNNLFENVGSSPDASICAVYLDDGISGMEVDGNIFYKAGTPGVYNMGAIHVNGGGNNYFRNNYFIDCHQAFSNTQWKDQQWKDFVSNRSLKFFSDINFRSAAYAQKYPQQVRLTDSVNINPRVNYSLNSLAYNVPVFSTGASFVNKNILNTTEDPGFADLKNGNFALSKAPPALQGAGDWKPVPFNEIGIRKK